MKALLAAIFTLLASTLSAQSNFVAGAITKTNGETITGQIDYREWMTNPQQIKFRASADSEAETFSLNDLSEFKINHKNEIYQRAIVDVNNEPVELNNLVEFSFSEKINRHVPLDRDTVFLLVLAKGRLNLYMLNDERSKKHFFIQKDGGNIEELIYRRLKILEPAKGGRGLLIPKIKEINDYKNQLILAMQECPSLNNSIERVFYSYSILNIVKQYNQCVGQSSYIRPRDRAKHSFYTFAGGGRSFVTFKDYYNPSPLSMSTSFTPTAGLGFELGLLRTNNRLSIGLEASFIRTQLEFSGLADNLDGTFKNVDYKIDVPAVRFNALVKYVVYQREVQPYLKAGLGFSAFFNTKHTRTVSDSSHAPTVTESDLEKSEPYAIGCLGLKVRGFFIESRYELGSAISNVSREYLKMNRLSVVAGFSWALNKHARQ